MPSATVATPDPTPEIPIEKFEVYATGVDHPECVTFARDGILWAGGEAGQIYRIGSDRKPELVTTLGGFCAGIAFAPDGSLFVCNPALGIVRVQPSGAHDIFATRGTGEKLICPNFGVFDGAGNYYVTDSGQWKKNNGRLLWYRPDGTSELLAGPMGYTNGLALSADDRSLFMVESNTDSVWRFQLTPDGGVAAKGVYATNCGRFPDGLALDDAGNLYVCCYASDEVWRISPAGEKTLFAWDRWAILLGSPTNMAFGGPNRDELYIANLARTTITRAQVGIRGQPLAHQR